MFGFERSGTTLLSMIMGAHPELAVPLSVTGLWYRYSKLINKYSNALNELDIEGIIQDILREERIHLWDADISYESVIEKLEKNDFPSVIKAFHEVYANKKEKPYWGNLDIATLDSMHIAHLWFPNAKFIHIVRDGRDVALSHETMPYGSANIMDCAQDWEKRLSINLRMGDILGGKRYLLVRYEDLILDTDNVLEKICKFIELPFSAKMLDYCNMVESKIPPEKRWLWPALSEKPNASRCYRWKHKMPTTKRIVFENEASDLLEELGYETYPEIPKAISAYLYETYCFIGRGGRFKRIKQRLGISTKSKLEKQWQKEISG